MRVDAAFQISSKLLLDVPGQRRLVVLSDLVEEGLEMLGHKMVEQRPLRPVLAILPWL